MITQKLDNLQSIFHFFHNVKEKLIKFTKKKVKEYPSRG